MSELDHDTSKSRAAQVDEPLQMPAQAGEPWMRGTHAELDPLRRAVIHALEQAEEDAARWAAPLDETEAFARPYGLPCVAFHLRHIARSLDRLLTYAEGGSLDEAQLGRLGTEMASGTKQEAVKEFEVALRTAKQRITCFDSGSYAEVRGIGRKQLPTTVAGLLIHCAEHTQRHAGQMVTTAKVARAETRRRSEEA